MNVAIFVVVRSFFNVRDVAIHSRPALNNLRVMFVTLIDYRRGNLFAHCRELDAREWCRRQQQQQCWLAGLMIIAPECTLAADLQRSDFLHASRARQPIGISMPESGGVCLWRMCVSAYFILEGDLAGLFTLNNLLSLRALVVAAAATRTSANSPAAQPRRRRRRRHPTLNTAAWQAPPSGIGNV